MKRVSTILSELQSSLTAAIFAFAQILTHALPGVLIPALIIAILQGYAVFSENIKARMFASVIATAGWVYIILTLHSILAIAAVAPLALLNAAAYISIISGGE